MWVVTQYEQDFYGNDHWTIMGHFSSKDEAIQAIRSNNSKAYIYEVDGYGETGNCYYIAKVCGWIED